LCLIEQKMILFKRIEKLVNPLRMEVMPVFFYLDRDLCISRSLCIEQCAGALHPGGGWGWGSDNGGAYVACTVKILTVMVVVVRYACTIIVLAQIMASLLTIVMTS
jgi:hypothetical protein